MKENGRGEIQRGMGIVRGRRSWSWSFFCRFVILDDGVDGGEKDDDDDGGGCGASVVVDLVRIDFNF